MNASDRAIPIEELQQLFGGSIPYRRALGFYLDESIDVLVVEQLRAEAIPATNVFEHMQLGESSDLRVLAKARELGRVLVTGSARFEAIHEHLTSFDGLTHAGIVMVRSRAVRAPRGHLAALLSRLADRFDGFPDGLEGLLFRL